MLVLARTVGRDRRFARLVIGGRDEIEVLYIIEGRAKLLVTMDGREREFWILPKEQRKLSETVTVHLERINGGQVTIGVIAPRAISVMRAELVESAPDEVP